MTIPEKIHSFTDYNLDPAILKALEKMDFKAPSSIQAETIPLIQKKHDLIALAQTGSGKTAACAIPICDRVNTTIPNIQTLIVVPTRELALQYATETQKIGQIKGVKAFAIYGGEDPEMQKSKLKHGVQVLVATPGRLIDFIYSRSIDLSQVDTLILDEADEMLSMGFYDDLDFIMQCLVHEHQTLLFSATMPKEIRKIAKTQMRDPIEVSLLVKNQAPSKIEHHFVYCRPHHRTSVLLDLIKEFTPKQGIIFCQSRHQCEDVCHALKKEIDAVDYLHAGLSQDIRTIITSKFRSGRIKFLVATDVAARGLDFSEVTHVFLYHLADDPDIYLHRAGRTGRQEREGVVITLVSDRELGHLPAVLQKINKVPQWIGKPPPDHKISHGRSNEKRNNPKPS